MEFMGEVLKEPFYYFHGSGLDENHDKINIGFTTEKVRPDVEKELELYPSPLDRILLGICDKIWFYHHYDSMIIDKLKSKFPNSNFMMWIRDLRDVITSYAFPNRKSWPMVKFPSLGDSEEERFKNAIKNIERGIKYHIKALINYNIKVFHYEDFTRDFKSTAKEVLSYLDIGYDDEKVEEIKSNFEPTHGYWEDWDDWQREYYEDSSLSDFNQILHYEEGIRDSILF